MSKTGIIYCATNTVNGKVYIGKTLVTLSKRRRNHIFAAKKGAVWAISGAIRKHGIGVFEWRVLLDDLEADELDYFERYFIKKHNSKVPHGYNMTDGGDGGPIRLGMKSSEETRRKISAANKGKSRGPLTEARKQKIAAALRGKTKTKEHVEKVRKSLIGRVVPEDQKNRMRAAHLGVPLSESTRNAMKLAQAKRRQRERLL